MSRSGNWNEPNLNPLANTIGGQVPVPAAAVIPAPIAYINVVAVKKLVVGFRDCGCGEPVAVPEKRDPSPFSGPWWISIRHT